MNKPYQLFVDLFSLISFILCTHYLIVVKHHYHLQVSLQVRLSIGENKLLR